MSAETRDIVPLINKEWCLTLLTTISENELAAMLAIRINELIKHDMGHLVSILYRIDVDEKKIREMLAKNKDTDAGLIIAHLVIERQKQKIKTRSMFNTRVEDINEEDKW